MSLVRTIADVASGALEVAGALRKALARKRGRPLDAETASRLAHPRSTEVQERIRAERATDEDTQP